MALTMLQGQLLEGVKLVRIITEEATPKTYNIDTAEEVEAKPMIEKGINKVKRNKNTIIGRVRTEDLISGMELALKDATLKPEVIQIVDGGTLSGTGATTKYSAPVAGIPVTRTPFKLEVYTADLDTDGDIEQYVKFVFPHCKGTPVEYSMKDGDFFVPELKLESAPSQGESPYTWEFAAALPTT
jgi:hypothetical protein